MRFDQSLEDRVVHLDDVPLITEVFWGWMLPEVWNAVRAGNQETIDTVLEELLTWTAQFRDTRYIRTEEVRCILGAPKDRREYLEGDDLSDNLFRASLNEQLRISHSSRGADQANESTIATAIEVTYDNLALYWY
jgi:hypothetical protein